MYTNVILTNKRRTHAQSNYNNTKLKAWFRRLLRHPARKRSGPIVQPRTPHPYQYTVTVTIERQDRMSVLILGSSTLQALCSISI